MTLVIIHTSCPDPESAERIAQCLVEEGLAACVSRIAGVVSTYRWQGQLQVDQEILLLIKTSMSRYKAVRKRILELHPHELPEIIAVEAAASYRPYREWVARAVAT